MPDKNFLLAGGLMSNFKSFMEKKRREHERALTRHKNLGTPKTWKMKLRVRLLSKVNSNSTEIKTSFLGRRVKLRSRHKGEALNKAEWLIFTANRFKTAEAAATFGLNLQAALSAVCMISRRPIDVGADNHATSAFSETVKKALANQGHWLLDDVHGVDVYPDTATAFVMGMQAAIKTSFKPEVLLEPIEAIRKDIERLDNLTRDASFLMNAACVSEHPAARLVLAVSAIEMLASEAKWNDAQIAWITHVRQDLESSDLSEYEKSGLMKAVNGLGRVGVLEAGRRLLSKLSLSHLVKEWNEVYSERSAFLHGRSYFTYARLNSLASKSMELATQVVSAKVYSEVPTTKLDPHTLPR